MLPDMSDKNVNIESAVEKALEDEELLSELLDGLTSKKETLRYNCFKVLMLISKEHGELLYPGWDYFVELLSADNTYWKMSALQIIASLTKVDTEDRFETIFDNYYELLDDRSVIPAAHVAGNSGKIARAKPGLQTRITNRLLGIDKTHRDPQRKDLVKGYAIEAFSEYFEEANNKKEIVEFVEKQLESDSPRTRKTAKEFLGKLQPKA